jgi:hypothetical protein
MGAENKNAGSWNFSPATATSVMLGEWINNSRYPAQYGGVV